MCTNYFENLASLARKLDEGIAKLQNAWEIPSAFIGGCAEITEETQEDVESLKKFLQSTQDEVNKQIKLTTDANNDMNCLIKEAQDIYDSVKQDVDELETVFEQFGYRYNLDDKDNSSDPKGSEEIQNSNCSYLMEEVPFTPDLSWRCKKKSVGITIPSNEDICISEDNATLNKLLDDTSKSKESKKAQELHSMNCTKYLPPTPNLSLSKSKFAQETGESSRIYNQILTPLRDKPQDYIYSRHFYSLLKQTSNKK